MNGNKQESKNAQRDC